MLEPVIVAILVGSFSVVILVREPAVPCLACRTVSCGRSCLTSSNSSVDSPFVRLKLVFAVARSRLLSQSLRCSLPMDVRGRPCSFIALCSWSFVARCACRSSDGAMYPGG